MLRCHHHPWPREALPPALAENVGIEQEPWRRAIFPALLVAFALAYLWRMSGLLPVEPVTGHLSNFYLSGAAVTLVSGPQAFIDPARRRRALATPALFAGVNVVAELLLAVGDLDDRVNRAMGDVNTTDPVDGLFGLAAVALVVVLLPRERKPARIESFRPPAAPTRPPTTNPW